MFGSRISREIRESKELTRSFFVFADSDGPVGLELPNQWLWDIIDEFIYQFQSFCNYRNRLRTKTEEEIALLRDNIQVDKHLYKIIHIVFTF